MGLRELTAELHSKARKNSTPGKLYNLGLAQ